MRRGKPQINKSDQGKVDLGHRFLPTNESCVLDSASIKEGFTGRSAVFAAGPQLYPCKLHIFHRQPLKAYIYFTLWKYTNDNIGAHHVE